MARADTITKIVESYFAVVTKEPFTYRGRTFKPKTVRVSPGIFRGYTCPPMCGGCCRSVFTLDYLPGEDKPPTTSPRKVEFNRRKITVHTDPQEGNDGDHCKNLRPTNGRCKIYPVRPFSCDFELIRSSIISNPERPNQLTVRLYGRGWNMMRVDGERGALCEITPATEKTKADTLRKLRRLQQWAKHFKLKTWLPEIIKYVEGGPHTVPLILGRKS